MDINENLRVIGGIRKISQESDAPNSELEVLLYFGHSQQELKAKDILRLTNYSPRNMNFTLNSLFKKGLIAKLPRKRGYVITETGAELYDDIRTRLQNYAEHSSENLVEIASQ